MTDDLAASAPPIGGGAETATWRARVPAGETPAGAVMCGDPGHPRPVRAVARMSWPDGPVRYSAVACIRHLQGLVRLAVKEGHPILVQPIPVLPDGPDREVMRLHAAVDVRRRALGWVWWQVAADANVAITDLRVMRHGRASAAVTTRLAEWLRRHTAAPHPPPSDP